MRRVALVTGASAGLGVEFSRQLAGRGYDLLLVARREDRLREVASELSKAYPVEVTTRAADLSDALVPKELAEFAENQGLQIDYLVNNTGSAGPDLLEDRCWDNHARFLELMVISVAQMCHHLVPPMRERGFGRIINVASFAGRIPRPSGSNYGPAKAYVIALSEELALRMRGTGVKVSALCPGFVHTDFHETGGLMEMKRATPEWVWYEAETVVREGIRAVERGRPIMVSGRLYRWLDPFAQSVWTRPLLKALAPRR